MDAGGQRRRWEGSTLPQRGCQRGLTRAKRHEETRVFKVAGKRHGGALVGMEGGPVEAGRGTTATRGRRRKKRQKSAVTDGSAGIDCCSQQRSRPSLRL
ncbi:hypothetical protein VTN00DRAFT_275 [Thermoascus crustaceus]|uniref:uncharacterized protein n=1 Tax=Thermoascus crustaceus TaxID=5088 RepID=UPI0037435E05